MARKSQKFPDSGKKQQSSPAGGSRGKKSASDTSPGARELSPGATKKSSRKSRPRGHRGGQESGVGKTEEGPSVPSGKRPGRSSRSRKGRGSSTSRNTSPDNPGTNPAGSEPLAPARNQEKKQKNSSRGTPSQGPASKKGGSRSTKTTGAEKQPGGSRNRRRAVPARRSGATGRRENSAPGSSHSGGPARKVLWIPGLGADRRMYGPLRDALKKLGARGWEDHFIDFPSDLDILKEVTDLESLARVTLKNCIQPLQKHHKEGRPYYHTVVGVSMGGMLAQILVGQNRIHTENLILISTAYRGQDVRQPFLALARIPWLLPGFLRMIVQNIIGRAYPLFRKNVKQAREFALMFLDFPRKIFFEAPVWIKKWKGEEGLQATLAMKPLPPDSHSVRAFRIHGTSDPLLSYRKIRKRIELDVVIQKGSHIVFATHASTLAEEIHGFLNAETPADQQSVDVD